MEDGLNYWDGAVGRWREASEEIEITADGAEAVRGQHRVRFSTNANDPEGAVDVELPGGARMRSSVLALRYVEEVTGAVVWLGTVRDAPGELLPPGQVIYRDAFDEVRADVVYTYRRNGLEVDVVLRELPPGPGEFGLKPERTHLEVLTEFFEAPEPARRVRYSPPAGEGMAEGSPGRTDEQLDFGSARILEGRSFAWSAREAARRRPEAFAPVAKRWVRIPDGRVLLIESVEYLGLLWELALLPGTVARQETVRDQAVRWSGFVATTAWNAFGRPLPGVWEGWTRERGRPRSSPGRTLMDIVRRPPPAEATLGFGLQLAKDGSGPEPGLVIDWNLVNVGETHFTFASTNTYLVTGECLLGGTTTLEGGAVIKFLHREDGPVGLRVMGALVCRTGPYRPVVLTSVNDNSVGEAIAGGWADAAVGEGASQLRIEGDGGPLRVEHLRFKQGLQGLLLEGDFSEIRVRHCQFVGCQYPVVGPAWTPVWLENVLIDGGSAPGVAFSGKDARFVGEHLTLRRMFRLTDGAPLSLTNSLVVEVEGTERYEGDGNWQTGAGEGVFESAGEGRCYLAARSLLRNRGKAGIGAELRRDLRELTTEAPRRLTVVPGTEVELRPRVARDQDVPDLGYHYAAVDYLVGGGRVAEGTLRCLEGVVLGIVGQEGVVLGAGGRLEFLGSPLAPVRWVSMAQVQEQGAVPSGPLEGSSALVRLEGPGRRPIPLVVWRFTEASLSGEPAHRRHWIRNAGGAAVEMAVSHSRLADLVLDVDAWEAGTVLSWTNNVFEDCQIRVVQAGSAGAGPMVLRMFNQLFRGGRIELKAGFPEAGWEVRDTLFDCLELSVAGLGDGASHNGFRAGLPGFGRDARSGLTLEFQECLVGRYTYPQGLGSVADGFRSLVDSGSRPATVAGLHGFTVRSTGEAEGDTMVDIGFHYPATASAKGGLAAYWNLDESEGDLVSDLSGAGNVGRLWNGPVRVAAVRGNGLRMDGVNDWVVVTDAPELRMTQAFTVAFWVRKQGELADWVRWVGKGGPSTRNYGVFDWQGASGKVLFQFQRETGEMSFVASSASVPVARWCHVVCTWDGQTGRIYLNGVLDTVGVMAGPPVTSSDPVTLGYGGFHGHLFGELDEVCLYQRVLSPEEIVLLFRNGAPGWAMMTPVSWWSLDEGQGYSAGDKGIAGRVGRLTTDQGWIRGVRGNALAFDGTDDWVSVRDTPEHRFAGPFSVTFWGRKDSERPDWVRWVGKGGRTVRNFGVFDHPGPDGRVLFQYSVTNGGYAALASQASLGLYRWHHVACTWDGRMARIYLDGEVDSERVMPGGPVPTRDSVTFGYAGYHDPLHGALDEVAFHARALSSDEVRAMAGDRLLDEDSDGAPDALEDGNGNGIWDPGEMSMLVADTDADGRNDAMEWREGTDPADAGEARPVRLALWDFDDPLQPWVGQGGVVPVEATAVRQVVLTSRDYGAEFNQAGAVLRYRCVESDGRPNLGLLQGTIRLCYLPYWSSAGGVCGGETSGTGPGVPIDLMAVGEFSIRIDASGTRLFFRSPDGRGGAITNAQVPIRVCAGDYSPEFPLEIQVSYGTNLSGIFLGGNLVAWGTGVRALPLEIERALGIQLGMSLVKGASIQGVLDSVTTYNVPLDLVTPASNLRAEVQGSPPSITLRWDGLADGRYRIERWSRADPVWRRLASVGPPSYTDERIVPGQEYEYRVSVDAEVPEEVRLHTDPRYQLITCGVDLPPAECPGQVMLIVDRTLMASERFANAVEGVTRDLIAEGWRVTRYEGPRHDDRVWANNPARVQEVRSWIARQWLLGPRVPKVVYLLGHLPIPFSGMLSPDGHGYRPLPADGYYGDMDGLWSDARAWPLGPGIVAPNLPGDGIFDQELVPPDAEGLAAVEMAVGRVDFANLPSYMSAPGHLGEVDLIVQYVEKVRRYRCAEQKLPEQVLWGAYFCSDDASEATDPRVNGLKALVSRLSVAVRGQREAATVPDDFFRGRNAAVWGIQGGYAGGAHLINSRMLVNEHCGVSPHSTEDLAWERSPQPRVAFYVMEASWMSEWHAQDHLGRGLLATRDFGYGWSYAGADRIVWQYPVLALGATLGEGWLRTQNRAWMHPLSSVLYESEFGTGVRAYFGELSQGGYLCASLLGDPTLRQAPEPPPEGLQGMRGDDGLVSLSWTTDGAQGVMFHVYRSAEGLEGEWKRVTTVPLTTPGYTDTEVAAASTRYLVRRLVRRSVASGSYLNLSAGAFWP